MNLTQPITYTNQDHDRETNEGKCYEQELLKSVFDFDSKKKDLKSMKIFH